MRLQMVLGIAGVLLGALGFKHIQNVPDLSTPKATVLSMLAAYANHDVSGLAKCVDGAITSGFPQELLTGELPLTAAKGKDFLIEVNGDSAKVAVEYEATIGSNALSSSTIAFVDMMNLKKVGTNWLIVPGKLDIETAGTLPLVTRPLSLIAAVIGPDPGYRNAILLAQKRAIATSCLRNSKQVALGMLMYVQDYDEVFPRTAAGYQSLITPYVAKAEIFQCGLDAKGTISYSMNVNLQNRSLADVASPASTVLLYEGHNGVVEYRHEGRAAIACADGQVKLMTESEVKALTWKLPPPKPKKVPAKKKTNKR